MRPYPHTHTLSTQKHHDWMLFGFTAVLRLLASVDARQIQHTLLQPTLYGIETGPVSLPESAFLHYLRTHPARPGARLAAFKQLAVGLRYAALVDQSLDDVYVEEDPDATCDSDLRNLRLHMASRGQSVLRVLSNPQAQPDGGIFIQAGHPLGWFEIGPPRAVSELAMAVAPRRSIANAAASTTPWFLSHRAIAEPSMIWSWAPSLSAAAADFDALSAAALCGHPAQ